MENKHTSGEWETYLPGPKNSVGYVRVKETQEKICQLEGNFLHPEVAANAHILAAAPELLKALKEARQKFDRLESDSTLALCDEIDALITKATGVIQ